MKFKVFFQLIRWKNLLLGIATLVLIKYYLIQKFIPDSNFSNFDFFLFIFGVASISAGGYVYNDIIDLKADLINKPDKTYIGSSISKKSAQYIIALLFILGSISGIVVAVKVELWYLSFYFLSIIIGLIAYSKNLKSIALIGNVTVSVLISSSIIILPYFEKIEVQSIVFQIISAYTLFALMINFIRELVKDIEDINGDFALNYTTLPIIIGVKRTRFAVLGFSILFYLILIFVTIHIKRFNVFLFYYAMVAVLVPLLYFIYKLYNAKTKKDYSKISQILKLIMLLGILSIFAF